MGLKHCRKCFVHKSLFSANSKKLYLLVWHVTNLLWLWHNPLALCHKQQHNMSHVTDLKLQVKNSWDVLHTSCTVCDTSCAVCEVCQRLRMKRVTIHLWYVSQTAHDMTHFTCGLWHISCAVCYTCHMWPVTHVFINFVHGKLKKNLFAGVTFDYAVCDTMSCAVCYTCHMRSVTHVTCGLWHMCS